MRIVAFEPNPDVYELLKWNLNNLPIASAIVPKGVSSFEGTGRLSDRVTIFPIMLVLLRPVMAQLK